MLYRKNWQDYSTPGGPGFLLGVGRSRRAMSLWENLSMPGFEALLQQTQTVILPLGSLEEHGPHLPLGTDTFHAIEVARRVAELRPLVVAPPVFYGMCRSTREHPGTISISGD